MLPPQYSLPRWQKGPYFSLIDQLLTSYPTLFHLTDWEHRLRIGTKLYPVHASVLEFHDDNVESIDFDSRDGRHGLERLAQYLASSASATRSKCRLYMLRGPLTRLFAAHIRDAHWGDTWEHGNPPRLPSFSDPEQSFTLRYYETRYFDDPNMPEISPQMKTLGNVSRFITFGKKVEKMKGHLGTIRRNASFWSRVLVLDPPITKRDFILDDGDSRVTTTIKGSCHPYQGGYRDFTPWPNAFSLPLSDSNIQGPHLEMQDPRRTSLIHDLIYYWRFVASVSQIQSATKSPYASTIFLRHVIASIWTSTLERQHTILSESETLLLHSLEPMVSPGLTDEMKNYYMGKAIEVLNQVNTLRRRSSWYVPEMKLNLEALAVSPDYPNSSRKEGDRDFLAVYNRLLSHQSWAEKLMTLITTHVNLMETEKSISDSKSLQRLTILGFFFVPVSFVCSFFSMNGAFAVGESKLWVYFAVTVPLTLTILWLAFRKQWWRWWVSGKVKRLCF